MADEDVHEAKASDQTQLNFSALHFLAVFVVEKWISSSSYSSLIRPTEHALYINTPSSAVNQLSSRKPDESHLRVSSLARSVCNGTKSKALRKSGSFRLSLALLLDESLTADGRTLDGRNEFY
ncbi:uncharacterized [Tachysurus ichikawai]